MRVELLKSLGGLYKGVYNELLKSLKGEYVYGS